MQEKLTQILEDAKQCLREELDERSLEELRVRYLGKKGELTLLLRSMGDLAPEDEIGVDLEGMLNG